MPADKTIPRDRGAYSLFTPVTMRYSDQDPNRHINNVAISAYLESGRVGFLHDLFEDRLPDRSMVLVSMDIDYLQEIFYPGSVEVAGRLAAVGKRSITTQYAIFQGDKCCVVSQSVNVFFDPETRRSTVPPDNVRKHLEEQVALLT